MTGLERFFPEKFGKAHFENEAAAPRGQNRADKSRPEFQREPEERWVMPSQPSLSMPDFSLHSFKFYTSFTHL
jgi:hypothetical protein